MDNPYPSGRSLKLYRYALLSIVVTTVTIMQLITLAQQNLSK